MKAEEWFPMRVTYSRELSVKAELDRIGLECFVPLRNELMLKNGHRQYVTVPAIHNLVFVRSSQDCLQELKNSHSELLPMRFIVRRNKYIDDNTVEREILRIPDRQMENFMRVASVTDERVFFLKPSDFLNSKGRKVRITDGEFAGVEGVIKRIQKNKRVVVQLEGVAAVAIAFVPTGFLVYSD